MRFAEFLRTTVLLSAAAASLLAAITVVGAVEGSDSLLVPVAAGWWVISVIVGLWLGRRAETSSPIANLWPTRAPARRCPRSIRPERS